MQPLLQAHIFHTSHTYMHLLDVRSSTLISRYDSNLSDVDGAGTCLMTAGHVAIYPTTERTRRTKKTCTPTNPQTLTAEGDGSSHGEVPILPVHVVSARARVVGQPHPHILDLQRALVFYLSYVQYKNKSARIVEVHFRGVVSLENWLPPHIQFI